MPRGKNKKRKKPDSAQEEPVAPKKAEELELESFLFGESVFSSEKDADELLQDFENEDLTEDEGEEEALPLFIEDRVGDPVATHSSQSTSASSLFSAGDAADAETSGPAWVDEDDEDIKVNIAQNKRLRKLRQDDKEAVITGAEYTRRLQAMHSQLYSQSSWVDQKDKSKDSDDDDNDETDGDEEEEIPFAAMQTTGSLQKQGLTGGHLSILRVKDANQTAPSQAVVQSVRFHPNSQLLMTAGLDKKLRLFQIDGRRNALVQSVFLSDMPIKNAAFTNDGKQIIAGGRRKFFYSYDLMSGKASKVAGIRGRKEKSWENFSMSPDNKHMCFYGNDGYMVLVDTQSKQWIGQMKMNGSLRATSFSNDGLTMYSFGSEGKVYLWDIRQRRCRGQFLDDGCVSGTALASTDRFMATGQDSGVVNIYNKNDSLFRSGLSGVAAKPVKRVMSLVTPVDHMVTNHSGDLLAIASQRKKDALRLVHLPTQTVYTNWPTSTTPLHYVTAMDFSPTSGFLAIGNDRGRVLLYRLPHYSAA